MEHAAFVHLHTHSEYSVLDGASKIDDLIKKANQYRMPALAITDHGNMFGVLEFYKKAMAGGIKPIIGQEFYVAPSSMRKKDQKEKPYHLILLAKDEVGYKNLIQLSSRAYLEGFYYKPRIDKKLLREHYEGLVCMSACLAGEIPSLILKGEIEQAKKKVSQYLEIFGTEDYYLEVMDNGIPEQQTVNRELISISRQMGLKVVATNDIHYLEQSDAAYHDCLLCIQTGKTIYQKNRLKFKTDQFYFKSPQQMLSSFSHYPQATENTLEITQKCNLSLDLGRLRLPHFPIPQGHTPESYLEELTRKGIVKKYGSSPPPEVHQRVQKELEVIESMGFSTYFLIVWDFIRFAKTRGIFVGPGRGSAAGSIVAYALDITNVEPLKYGLLFERFLNVSRISMPDIDIDFDGERRDEVIRYVRQKYGDDKVAQIITFGAMKARAVVRDVARAMDYQPKEVDSIAKKIPRGVNITIEEALATSRELGEMVKSDSRIKRLFDISRKLEKLVRHPSTHAAGVVISPQKLDGLVPLYKDPKSGVVSTQFQAQDLEDVGLIKMDFLGLKNLTLIQRCLEKVKEAGQEVPDIHNVDLEDKRVYQLLSQGKSTGVFQLESSGMQNLLKRLCPNRFEDIIAVLALYRPGPLDSGMVDEFIERKNGTKPITCPDQRLKEVLKDTYGVIVYQEQVMEIAQVIGGFSLAEADNLRKAMGKKKPEILEEAREKFLEGAQKKNVRRKIAEEIFDMIKTFGRYGFNKSHSSAYALLAFQTAYLKVHYPVFYLASLLTGELNDTDKIAHYIAEARDMGIEVHGPDVNKSGVFFEADGSSIRYALSAVKNVGENAARNIVEERSKTPFSSIFDFTSRVDLRLVNRRVMESLVKSGAMDALGPNRRSIFNSIPAAFEHGTSIQGDRLKGQHSLFDEMEESYTDQGFYQVEEQPEWSEAEFSEYEKEAMGFYFKAHPVARYSTVMEHPGVYTISGVRELGSDVGVSILGIVVSVKKIMTRDNKEMAFLGLEDTTGYIEAVVFPSIYESCSQFLNEKKVIVVSGRTDGEKIIADRIMYPEAMEKQSLSQVHIVLDGQAEDHQLLRLRDLLLQNKGHCSIFIHTPHLEGLNKVVKASTFLGIEPTEELLSTLKKENLVKKVWVS
ncbi:MAG: DNA polymerase III subunit alpha [Spirochaetota bacterium]